MNTEITNCVCECACCAVNNTTDGTDIGTIVFLIIIIWLVGLGIFINKTL